MYTYVEERDEASLREACRCLGVSRRGYHIWRHRKMIPNKSSYQETWIRDEIQRIACEFPRYGYRRVTHELARRNISVNHKRVHRLMKEDNLLCIKRRFKPQTTDSNHKLRTYPNLAKDMKVTDLNQLWVADITYIRLMSDFVYLAVLMDVYSRKCIGWDLDRYIDTKLTLNALDMALSNRNGMKLSGLVHHSDQGVQYASNDYINLLNKNSIHVSMSRKGNPYDNAFAESFIKTLKHEEVYLKEYETFDEAYQNIQRFIEKVYNQKRIHSSIGYKTPSEYEKEVIKQNIKLLT